ncbi:MAG: ABC transporter ATP-binding protein [Deltaproteobacteria bacterium]|nr:ABC transporter ATP-binding protein [Deltaproteobacteria bacterium]
MSVLEVENLLVRYPGADRPALDGVQLDVAPNERVALVGPNASGKTTLLHALVGLVPLEGRVTIDGVALSKASRAQVRSRVGFLFAVADDQILFPRVIDDVLFALRRLDHGDAERKARHVLARLGVSDLEERSPHHLSLGQRKRVALAGALVAEPPLLLLDEPSGGLDPRGTADLASLLAEVPCAMLMASHNLDFVCRVCSRVLLIDQGRVVGQEVVGRSEVDQEAAKDRLLQWMLGSGPTPGRIA